MTHVAEALSWLRHDLAVVIGIMTPRSESCIGLCIYSLKTSSSGLIALTEMFSKRERKKDVILHSCSIATNLPSFPWSGFETSTKRVHGVDYSTVQI